MLTRRELAAVALAAAAGPLAGCGDDDRRLDVGAFDAVPEYWVEAEFSPEARRTRSVAPAPAPAG